ncbi:FAM207A isoform 2 [Pan troglodytes]|uniref:Isoform B of Ribosome biogenesis protein SLX9 homolog n=2 Tax=Homininae TaxID=207598 RepID=Q9NSI2-2|nr:ribosome biogenesis protein SLX9 homolog isoform 3 [Homo sapiens]XP_034804046.1 ribosome biogenesis protein SLX9 homolog isoform X8 [Pan paniscus]XP_054531112.1 ribosome biogenesis protein SLX9 homolog isoform X4 [Pan troglodytes]XP_055229702.1 ribosome biogenesis protein SLX9 homolog isoform X3 [Gorilla gorilla gorilla]AAL34505.1 C21orf70 isoform B protein [Homo sapiens]EAX09370.1 chromosome 21 open reading frame 70, isoform CRA_d [Homo sapiens]KAI2596461.1 family with sequence similarity|eukprot:NP_001303913.1 protein FAM207A isoform 3 [Homo sapiens]
MGKVRGLRARVHQAAVRPKGEAAPGPAPPAPEATPPPASAAGKDWAFINTNIFARTKIDPSALVQKLELDVRSVTSVRRGAEAKTVLPKKEKMKLRREQWLQKIEAIKLAEQKHREERRRRATVVVGDLHPLRDALPELLGLEAGSRRQARSRESNKPRPSELSRMSAAQRQQLLEEERTRFQELLASPAYRASPLVAIGQTLARQMQLEDGGQL